MNYLKGIVGQQARRTTFSIKDSTNNYFVLYSVIELLDKDMQDIDIYNKENKYMYRSASSNSSKAFNVYMTIDWLEITDDFITNPIVNYNVYDTRYKFYSDKLVLRPSMDEPPYILQDSYHDDQTEIQTVLPLRQCTKSLYAYLDKNKVAAELIDKNDYLRAQLSEVSLKYYGVDLSLFPDHFGNIYILQYNPYFRNVDFSSSKSPNGIYVSIKFRKNVRETFLLKVSNKNKAGFYTFEIDKTIKSDRSNFFVEIPSCPDVISVKIYNSKGTLVYYSENMHFIQSIDLTMNVKSKDVKLITKANTKERVETVEKFISENHSIGNPTSVEAALGETTSKNAYRVLEENLEFLLFDGDKQKKDENVARAKGAVKKILGKAQNRCIICDPYFGLSDLSEFVFSMQKMNVCVRIMTSKEFLGKTAEDSKINAQRMSAVLNEYLVKVGGSIQIKLLTGKSPLHDRFIIADDEVWMLGSSLNEFGNRATTIVKVPKVSCRQIYAMAENWWTDSTCSTSLDDYANS